MNKHIPNWEDYIEQDYTYDPQKVQMVISADDLEPTLEYQDGDWLIMQDGTYTFRGDDKLVRIPINIQNTRVGLWHFLQSLPEA